MSSLSSQVKSAQMERDVLQSTAISLKDQLKTISDSSATLSSNLNARELSLQQQVLELQGAKEIQVGKFSIIMSLVIPLCEFACSCSF